LTRNGSSLPAILLEGGPQQPPGQAQDVRPLVVRREWVVHGRGPSRVPRGERKALVRETGQSERGKETQGVARASLCLFLHIPGVIAKANLDWLRLHTL